MQAAAFSEPAVVQEFLQPLEVDICQASMLHSNFTASKLWLQAIHSIWQVCSWEVAA